jgi:hypothetical protein
MILGKLLIPQAGTTLKSGLISCWELEETGGSTAYDSHGSNNLTSVGATVNQSGKIGKGYLLSDGYLYGSSRLITGFPLSVSWWLKPDPDTYNRLSTNVSGSPYRGMEIIMEAGQCGVQFGNGISTGSTSRKSYSLSTTISNEWHHVVVTATAHGTFNYYLDGVEKTGFSVSGTATSTSFTLGVPYVGKAWGSAALYGWGVSDQVAFWSKALTTDEVALLYNSGNGLSYSNW